MEKIRRRGGRGRDKCLKIRSENLRFGCSAAKAGQNRSKGAAGKGLCTQKQARTCVCKAPGSCASLNPLSKWKFRLNSLRWVELGVMAPGRSHYWFFDQWSHAEGSVFHATAYPEFFSLERGEDMAARRVAVTELFIIRENSGLRDQRCPNPD